MGSKDGSGSVAPIPARNRPRPPPSNSQTSHAPGGDQNTPSTSATTRKTRGNESEQLALLAKYTSRIADISTPYAYTLGYGLGGVGVGTNKKGPSQTANIKDKADRATNEQVLDPRTRIILFKMINRGLIEEINGCVSTGKEVSPVIYPVFRQSVTSVYRQTSITPSRPRKNISPLKYTKPPSSSSKIATSTSQASTDSALATRGITRERWLRCGRKRRCGI